MKPIETAACRVRASLIALAGLAAALASAPGAEAADPSDPRCLKLDHACAPRPPAACQQGGEAGAPESEPEACAAARDRWLSCNNDLVVACGPGLDHPSTKHKALLGTVWDGTGLRGGRYVFRFHDDGVLNYTTPTGTWTSGRWIHANGRVLISMNEGFAIYIGEISKNRMIGYADNTRAETWGWDLERTQ